MFPPNSPPAKVPPVPFIFSPSLLLHQELFLSFFLFFLDFNICLFIYLNYPCFCPFGLRLCLSAFPFPLMFPCDLGELELCDNRAFAFALDL